MSVYAVVLEAVKSNAGKTAAELEALIPLEADAVDNMLTELVADGRVTKVGVGAGATYTSASLD